MDDNVAHAYGMLDTESYKCTLTVCNTYCFSTATIVAPTCLNITLSYLASPVIHSVMSKV